jgi:universal stress protein E
MEKLQDLAAQQPITATLLMVDYNSTVASNLLLHPDGLAHAIDRIKVKNLAMLNDLAGQYQHNNIDYQFESHWHKPYYEKILEIADQSQACLIIKQANKHSKLRKMFYSSGDVQLIKSSKYPVLLSKGQALSAGKCVIAAVDPMHKNSDGCHLDDIIIQQAKDLAALLNLPLKLCHIFDLSGWDVIMNSAATAGSMGQFIVIDSPEEHEDMIEKLRENHHAKVIALQKRHQLKDDQLLLRDGFPIDTLEQLITEQEAAAIVVGTTYRSGLLGSTAEQLLDDIECDIVAVKGEGFDSPDNH